MTLPIDNCSAHRAALVNKLTNIEVIFLLHRITSIIQPCDQDIIPDLKHCYLKHWLSISSPTVIKIKVDEISLAITIYEALTLLHDARSKVPLANIVNSF